MNKLPHIPHSERLIVVVGPSGAGKDSVLRAWATLREPLPEVRQAQRVITRPADGGSEDHEPASESDFAALSAMGAFATTWSAHGLHYGVRHRELLPLADGTWVLLNGSRSHLPALRRQAPQLRVVEITAPAALRARRLAARAREDEAAVAARLQRTVAAAEADLTLVNEASLQETALGLHHWWLALATPLGRQTPDAVAGPAR